MAESPLILAAALAVAFVLGAGVCLLALLAGLHAAVAIRRGDDPLDAFPRFKAFLDGQVRAREHAAAVGRATSSPPPSGPSPAAAQPAAAATNGDGEHGAGAVRKPGEPKPQRRL